MKKIIFMLSSLCLLLMACSQARLGKEGEIEKLVGYIVLEDNILHIREVEIVNSGDRDKMEKYNLSEEDMLASDFMIIEKDKEESYELADQVDYIFTDVYLNFIDKEDGDRIYHTKNKEEFLKHLGQYSFNDIPLEQQKIPYFIELRKGRVISIREEFKYTI